jgi:hypothetical protein
MQLSEPGFRVTFHRSTLKPEREGEPSRWVFVAGRIHTTGYPVLVGLGLWAEQPNAIGRLNLEPNQWLDVLRVQQAAR